jgi:hypothetical protein
VLKLRDLLPESQLISKTDLRETDCEDEEWMELAQDCVQWQALVFVALSITFGKSA